MALTTGNIITAQEFNTLLNGTDSSTWGINTMLGTGSGTIGMGQSTEALGATSTVKVTDIVNASTWNNFFNAVNVAAKQVGYTLPNLNPTDTVNAGDVIYAKSQLTTALSGIYSAMLAGTTTSYKTTSAAQQIATSGAGTYNLQNVRITGTGGQFSCGSTLSGVTCTGTGGTFTCSASPVPLYIGMPMCWTGSYGGAQVISERNFSGAGSYNPYNSGDIFYIIATNGSTTFTLSNTAFGSALITSSGTPSGITYTVNGTTNGVLNIGQTVTITGTNTGSGSISGYSSGTQYYIIATNGVSTFTLSATSGGSAITTTAGTPASQTFAWATPPATRWNGSHVAEISASWNSANRLRWFFNQGGNLQITPARTGNALANGSASTKDLSMDLLLAEMGTVTLNGNSCSRSGSLTSTLSSVAITGTGGQFSCTGTNLAVGQQVVVSGTNTGSGSLTRTVTVNSTSGSNITLSGSTSIGINTPVTFASNVGPTGTVNSSVGNNITLASAISLPQGTPVKFSSNVGNLVAGTIYYVAAITNSSTIFTVATTVNGTAIAVGTTTGLSVTATFGLYTGTTYYVASTTSSSTVFTVATSIGGTPVQVGTATSLSITATLGYVNPTTYYITATNLSSTFTLSSSSGGPALTTVAGTTVGLTFTLSNSATSTVVSNTSIGAYQLTTSYQTLFQITLGAGTYSSDYLQIEAKVDQAISGTYGGTSSATSITFRFSFVDASTDDYLFITGNTSSVDIYSVYVGTTTVTLYSGNPTTGAGLTQLYPPDSTATVSNTTLVGTGTTS